MKNLFELGADFSDLQLWAVGCSVGPKGYVSFEGEQAREVSAHEASRIATLSEQITDIMWIDFSYTGDPEEDHFENYPVIGGCYIATSRRRFSEVCFRPALEVVESGRVTAYTARWVGYLARGNHDEVPRYFEQLVQLAAQRNGP